MYEVSIKNGSLETTIHHYLTSNDLQKLPSGKITKEINAIPSFKFDIYPNNPGFNRLSPYNTSVYVKNAETKELEFEGRVLISKPEMDEDGMISKSVTCEGVMAYLCDSIQPYLEEKYWEGDEERTGLEEFIDYILEVHNSQTEEYKHIFRDNVTVHPFESSDNVTKGLNYQTTYECVTDKLVDSFGGEFDVRRGDDGILYLDYVEAFGELKGTAVEVAVNMESMSKEPDPTSVITRLIPLGAKITADGADTEERLTIAEVNDGCIYLENALAIEEFGIIYGVVEFNDVTTASALKTKGAEYLESNTGILQKNTISALDLSMINAAYSEFKLYNSYKIYNNYLNEDSTARVIKQEIDICDPTSSTLTFGDRTQSLIDYSISQNKEYDSIVERVTKTENNLKINEGAVTEIREKTVYTTEVYYAVSDDATTAPESGWTAEGYEWQEGKYVWQKVVTTKGDGTKTESVPVCITGAAGADSVLMHITSSNGLVFKNDGINTTLSVVIYKGSERITDMAALKSIMGDQASLQWSFQRIGDDTVYNIDPGDTRISDSGFTFTISADDVNAKSTFFCELIVD